MSGIEIKRNLCTLAAAMDPPIVPVTTLTAPINIGNVTAQIAPLLDAQGRSRIMADAKFSIYDDTDEPIAVISNVSDDGTMLQFKWGGTLGSFQHDHPAGTKVYTNITPFVPWTLGTTLELGDPAIAVTVTEKHTNASFQPSGGFPLYVVEVQYLRQYEKPTDLDTFDDDLWSQQQEQLCLAEADAIATMLLQNQELRTDFHPPAAQQFGGEGQAQDLIVTRWNWDPVEGDIFVFQVSMRISVLGEAE